MGPNTQIKHYSSSKDAHEIHPPIFGNSHMLVATPYYTILYSTMLYYTILYYTILE